MAWIESHQELARHPKTKKFARSLGITLPSAVGHLHFFWWWAMDYAQDGDLSKYNNDDIADACGWEGDSSAITSALIDSGFIDEEDGLFIHDWDDYAGRLLDKRKANTERKRKSRGSHAVVTRDTDESHGATRPNQTLPNQTIPSETAATPATLSADSDMTDQKFSQVFRTIESQLVMLNAIQVKDVEDFLKQGMEPELIGEAVMVTKRKGMDISYLWGILSNCSSRQILTRQAFLEDRQRFEQSKRSHQNKGHPRGLSGKPVIPIIEHIPEDAIPTEEEFEAMRRKAQRLDGDERRTIANC